MAGGRSGTSAGCAFFTAWTLAGIASALIALVQVFAPSLADGNFIARSGLAGRAVGNIRQPNHLSSLLLWSAIAVVPLLDTGRLKRWTASALMALFVFAVVLTGSRTGTVGVLLLAAWGVADKRLSRDTRWLLIAAPVFYALAWWGMAVWAADTHHTFGAEARLAESDLSSSRFAIWRNTLAMIAQQPWTGVGFGNFNFAWTLTPFPDRPPAFFDHTHNIVLQFLVELGIPLGALVIGLLAWAFWQAFRRAWQVTGAEGSGYRAAFMMVLLMAVHSQLEYPLWYAYFLLPTAWAWGLCLGAGDGDQATRPADGQACATTRPPRRSKLLMLAGIAMVVGSVYSFVDYWKVVAIFAPSANAGPLSERIAEGQRSLFFAHHANYAAATTADHPGDVMPAFASATHYLLDTRLMLAWARAYAERGDPERARYIAARLREFHNPQSDEFFAPCDDPAVTKKPFQCEAPATAFTWRDFLQ